MVELAWRALEQVMSSWRASEWSDCHRISSFEGLLTTTRRLGLSYQASSSYALERNKVSLQFETFMLWLGVGAFSSPLKQCYDGK